MTGSTVVIRLRAYRGSQSDTAECFNGLRDEAADEIERLRAEVEALRHECDRAWEEVDAIAKDRKLLMARLDATIKDIADVVALQPPKPIVIEKPHGPVSDQLMQKFYGAKR